MLDKSKNHGSQYFMVISLSVKAKEAGAVAGSKGAAGTRDRDVRRGALAHLPRGYWRRAMLQEPFSCSVYRMPDAGYCALYAVCSGQETGATKRPGHEP